ncbi:dipicolinate synthase subunit B [Allocoprobacillus halotolerans]|uniref:Dipicolinate synthase subunit B n=1 Tax=Allocoprobacillus halotolerans TaxID=2944914 RepID=A0ABY5I0B8_9FIRM|nr:dipicolinate synthase subunit B [Allocoprobacillus halotolerans]UTY38786.1 dipicolinate synthase subunit B [Allocoprobacillus halotolerans]
MNKIGFAITGSFCSMDDMLEVLKLLCQDCEVEVFMTPHVRDMDTRFYSHLELATKIKEITHKDIHTSIQEAEVYGPHPQLDAVVVYPCDASTLNKIDLGINDNCVTMLVKSCVRNQIPIVLGVYSNDVLSNSGVHLLSLFNKKNYYFVPMFQDDYQRKPHSMIAKKDKVLDTLKVALQHQQYQPFLLGYRKI